MVCQYSKNTRFWSIRFGIVALGMLNLHSTKLKKVKIFANFEIQKAISKLFWNHKSSELPKSSLVIKTELKKARHRGPLL
jgi:hypothetical protein